MSIRPGSFKAEVYTQLGLTLTYQPHQQKVIAQATPLGYMYVRKCPRGDTTHNPMGSGL